MIGRYPSTVAAWMAAFPSYTVSTYRPYQSREIFWDKQGPICIVYTPRSVCRSLMNHTGDSDHTHTHTHTHVNRVHADIRKCTPVDTATMLELCVLGWQSKAQLKLV